MYSILFLTVASFVCCLVLTPIVRRASQRLGLVDRPGVRKAHSTPTPRTGGVAIALAYVLPIGVLLLLPLNAADAINLPVVLRMLPPIMAVFVVGLLDDVLGMEPWEKLIGQIMASILAFSAGVHIDGVAGYTVPAAWSLPLTVAWLLACANAFNLIDGLDGLASGVGLFAASTTLIAALLQSNAQLALATAPLVGALLAFLRYNFNPASIFLGDSGSLTIGFALGCFGAIWSQKSATLLGMTAPLIALAVPLIDTSVAILRRFIRHQPIFAGDSNHIHHRLLARGFSHRQVALVLYGACGLAAAFSLLVMVPGNRFAGLLLVIFCVVVWMGIRLLGYVEFDTARQLVTSGALREVLSARVYARSVQDRCAKAISADDFWAIVRDVSQEFGCSHVRMSLLGSVYEANERSTAGAVCTVRIPLSGGDYLNFSHPVSRSMHQAVAWASVMEVLQGAVTLDHGARTAIADLARLPERAGQTSASPGFSRVGG